MGSEKGSSSCHVTSDELRDLAEGLLGRQRQGTNQGLMYSELALHPDFGITTNPVPCRDTRDTERPRPKDHLNLILDRLRPL